ncbi:MAG TPA: hypothetical protein VGU66_08920 [Candidatus Elarobacter sp.]|nr:hypothetical protein [Candidatus Elarobacter sp.]
MEIRVDGIEAISDFAQELEQMGRVVSSLEGEIATVTFDPSDPASIDAAIHTVDTVIDRAVAPFRQNAMLVEITDDLKASFAEGIRRDAADALAHDGASAGKIETPVTDTVSLTTDSAYLHDGENS